MRRIDELFDYEKLRRYTLMFGSNPSDVDDHINDLYLKLHDKEKLNHSYVYLTLKSIVMNSHRNKKHYLPLDNIQIKDEAKDHEAYNNLHEDISKVVKSLNWFDRNLFTLYISSGLSIRKLSKATGIGTTTIYTTLKKVKNEVRNQVGKEYKDYKEAKENHFIEV